jgi:hypothetical protein
MKSRKNAVGVSSQKEGESGMLWASEARPQHPTPRFIEKLPVENLDVGEDVPSKALLETSCSDVEKRSLEQHLSHLDFSADSSVRVQLYRRLKRDAGRPARRQPTHVTILSRLGTVAALAIVVGSLLGMLRFQPNFTSVHVTALAAPHVHPVETPGTAVVNVSGEATSVHPRRLPTPQAPTFDNDWPVHEKGTLLP